MYILSVDIEKKIGLRLLKRRFWELSTQDKKMAVEEELITYTIDKLQNLNVNVDIMAEYVKNDLPSLLLILDSKLKDKKEKHLVFYKYTDFIINQAKRIQGFHIVEYIGKESKLILNPEIEFNNKLEWDKVTTHLNTSALDITLFVWDTFQNEFKVEPKEEIKTILIYTKKKNHR